VTVSALDEGAAIIGHGARLLIELKTSDSFSSPHRERGKPFQDGILGRSPLMRAKLGDASRVEKRAAFEANEEEK